VPSSIGSLQIHGTSGLLFAFLPVSRSDLRLRECGMSESVSVPLEAQASRSLLRKIFIGPSGLRSGWRFMLFNVFGFGFSAVLIFVRRALTPGTDHHRLVLLLLSS
jgi:hypothetical protein